MKNKLLHQNFLIVISVISLCVTFLSRCINKESEKKETIAHIRYEDFVGSETCKNCHKSIFDSHINTPHFFASQKAGAGSIKGSFEDGHNTFSFRDNIVVRMEKRPDAFYQVFYLNGVEQRAERFDIVFGSGTKGQSYLYWKDLHLFQLPVTYFTQANQWSNSPGYPGMPRFNRPITSRCLECHSTFFQKISGEGTEPEEFDNNKIFYGVSCEKCHGPAAKHVEFHTHNPSDTIGRFIINTGKLSRQQNLDLCALCHGGRLIKSHSSFSFQPGDKLSDYFKVDTTGKYVPSIDVHGNQLGLLAASKCFIQSQMTCGSCHDSHIKERGDNALFSQRCMNCHSENHGNFCKINIDKTINIKSNCIDCHMPKQRSMAIAVLLQGDEVPTAAMLRSHFITIYPEETKKFLAQMKKTKQ